MNKYERIREIANRAARHAADGTADFDTKAAIAALADAVHDLAYEAEWAERHARGEEP